MKKVNAHHMYSGTPSYFSGHCVKDNEFLATVYLRRGMTLKSFVQQVVDDLNGTDCGEAFYGIEDSEIAKAVRSEYDLRSIKAITRYMDRYNPKDDCAESVIAYVLLSVDTED